jgi:predicted nucleic acid-binding protein
LKIFCVDSNFLIALYDETEKHHSEAKNHFKYCFVDTLNKLVIPWPILYETISSRMARNKKGIDIFNKDCKFLESQRRLILLDDQEFRNDAFNESFAEVKRPKEHYRALSLTDRVIRKILSEGKLTIKIDFFITKNIEHFEDVCTRRKIIILNPEWENMQTF